MSKSKPKIDGVRCRMVLRGAANGEYTLLFDRRLVTLEQIEAINWAQPELTGDYDPLGYGFEATETTYSSSEQTYHVQLRVLRQYLGDVTGYQAQVAELEGTVAEQKNAIQTQQDTIAIQEQTITRQTEELQSQQADILEKDQTIQSQQDTISKQFEDIRSQALNVDNLTAAVVSVAAISTELPDALALDMAEAVPDCFLTWKVVLQVGAELAQGRVIGKDGQLYRVVQPVTPQAHQKPGGEGMLAIYRPIDREHAGTPEDPIPWVSGMDCLAGLYYSYNGAVYRVADGGNMIPCVWAPDTPGLWQWVKIEEVG